MLDTTVFNHLLRDELDPSILPADARYFVTHVQLNELQETVKPEKRALLLSVFAAVPTERVSTESAMWGISEWGAAKWGTNDGLFQGLLAALNELNGSKENNGRDILIAETAIRNQYVLVTDDRDLSTVVLGHGGKTIRLRELLP